MVLSRNTMVLWDILLGGFVCSVCRILELLILPKWGDGVRLLHADCDCSFRAKGLCQHAFKTYTPNWKARVYGFKSRTGALHEVHLKIQGEIWVHPFGTVTSLVHVSSSSGKTICHDFTKTKKKNQSLWFSSTAFCGFLDSRKKQNWTEKEELFSTQKPGHTIFSLESLPIYSINLQQTAPRPPLSLDPRRSEKTEQIEKGDKEK